MLRKLALVVIILAAAGIAAFFLLTMPRSVAASDLPQHTPDLANGEAMFWAGGCESCHAARGASGDDQLKLGGGLPLVTPFGTFHAPNISPDREHGIGTWSDADFVTAMKYGIGPDGTHLYPAFPYTSYQRMRVEDILDLKAFLFTLPPVPDASLPHDLPFPFQLRRGLGLWQLLYVDGKTFEPDPAKSATLNRGAYLVEGPGHCAQCHSPRNAIGGIDEGLAYAGAPAPEGKGTVPNITPDPDTGIGGWSEDNLVELFETGFTPDFDSLGGSMAAVQMNLAHLPRPDLEAIAAYLKSLRPIANKPVPAAGS